MVSRILSTCSPLISPAAWAAAVAASTGANDSPVRVRRGPKSAASVESAVGFGRRDPPPDSQDVFPGFGAHLLGRRLGLQPGQRAVPLRGQLTRQGFEFVEHGEQFAVGEHVEVAGGQRLVRGAQGGHRYLNRSRQHDSNIHSTTDKSGRHCYS